MKNKYFNFLIIIIFFQTLVLTTQASTHEKQTNKYKEMPKDYSGLWRTWDANGRLLHEENYKDGKKHGLSKRWGGIHIENYKNGKKHGICRGTRRSIKYETNYEEGKRHGTDKTWHFNGQLASIDHYHQGKQCGVTKRWHKNGQLAFEQYFTPDENYGLERSWYENGKPTHVRHVINANEDGSFNNKTHGFYVMWHENSQFMLIVSYKNGKNYGIGGRWNDEGEPYHLSFVNEKESVIIYSDNPTSAIDIRSQYRKKITRVKKKWQEKYKELTAVTVSKNNPVQK